MPVDFRTLYTTRFVWLLALFSPPPDATSRQVRVSGAKAILVGLPLLAAGIGILIGVEQLLRSLGYEMNPHGTRHVFWLVTGAPMALGYVLFMFGTYRLLTGTPPGKESRSVLASLGRILLGLTLTLVTIALASVLVSVLVSMLAAADVPREDAAGSSER